VGNRPKMPPSKRAKQFMPFAAVAGLEQALRKKEYELGLISRPEISEEMAEETDRKLCELKKGDDVRVTYYREGEIITARGAYLKFDEMRRIMIIRDIEISTDDILSMEIENKG
jgi:hypothetical protein